MLCPEVWNFQAPESKFSIQKTDSNHNQSSNIISNFYFSHLVSVVLPETAKIPASLSEALTNDCDYYKINQFNLQELVSKDFLNNFIKHGSLSALSVNTRIDCDNCVAVSPTGQLVLNLDKDTYQTLGLEGKVSHFHHKSKQRYAVSLDLKTLKKTDRIKKLFGNFTKFDLILSWTPPNEDVCPSSIAKYLNDLGYKVNLCKPKYRENNFKSMSVPNLADFLNEDVPEFVEWLGLVSIQGDSIFSNPDLYLSSYEVPEPNSQSNLKTLKFTGFFTNDQVQHFWDCLKEFLQSNTNSCKWISMYVQGFSDSPIAWDMKEHHFYTNGDNGFVLIDDGETSLVCTQKCSMKRYKNKYK